MKVAAAVVALAALAFAAPGVDKRDVNPASATASLLAVLPSSILNVAITNPAAATTLIESAFASGTPAWFTSLPTDVQSYFLTQVEAGPATATATGTGAQGTGSSSNSSATVTPKYGNSTTTGGSSTGGSSTKTGSSSGSSGTSGSSATSTGAASMPTAVIGGGLAGIVGLIGMLAL